MKNFGKLILFMGVCWTVFALNMDISVSTGSGGRVSNLGLMADRQIYTILGGVISLAGLLMILLSAKTTTASQQSIECDSRPCPLCAETIKNAAVKCMHCGADVEVIQEAAITAPLESAQEPSAMQAEQALANGPGLGFLSLCFGLIAVIVGGILYRVLPADTVITKVPKVEAYKPVADEQISLDSAAFGCMSSSDLNQALDHYVRSEYSVWAEIIGSKTCFYQNKVNPDISWTVMQVRDELMQVGLKRAVEYSKDPELGRFSYWTLTSWAQRPTDAASR